VAVVERAIVGVNIVPGSRVVALVVPVVDLKLAIDVVRVPSCGTVEVALIIVP
jgi:hypothetical protein